jgi:hypothetical protein
MTDLLQFFMFIAWGVGLTFWVAPPVFRHLIVQYLMRCRRLVRIGDCSLRRTCVGLVHFAKQSGENGVTIVLHVGSGA